MNGRHHVDPHARIQTELLGNARDFIRREHHAESEKRMRPHRNQAHQEKGGLHESRKADRNDLTAPSCESVRVPTRQTEQVQTAYRDLDQENPAALDVGEKALVIGLMEETCQRENGYSMKELLDTCIEEEMTL